MRSTMSILGLYNYHTSIFENFKVPEDVDSALAIQTLIFDNAELEIMYPEPETMKFLIGIWCDKELPIWEKIYRACTEDYNPIENYNRTESWSDTDIGSNSASSNGTETNKVTGYNDTQFTNHDQTTTTASGNGSSRLESRHNGNVKGNIGVTTSQQMLEQELEVAPKLDIYGYISRSFKKRFCLMVY